MKGEVSMERKLASPSEGESLIMVPIGEVEREKKVISSRGHYKTSRTFFPITINYKPLSASDLHPCTSLHCGSD